MTDNLMDLPNIMDLPFEILTQIFLELPIETLYQSLVLVNNDIYHILNNESFYKSLLNKNYPQFATLMLCTTNSSNFKKIYKSVDTTIKPKYLKYKVNNRQYVDRSVTLPFNIIATLLNLPKLEMIYTEIFAYLRCSSFEFNKLKDFSNTPANYRVTIFVAVNDNTLFNNYTSREKLNITFEDLFKKIVPINLKDEEQFKNTENFYAITIQINDDNTKELFFSNLNSDRDAVEMLFKEVKSDYTSKYS